MAWRHVRWGVATYRLRLERVGVILLEVIIDRFCVGVHSEVVCEGLEAQARSRKSLRRLVRGLSRRTEQARRKELRECINRRRLLVGYIKPQGWESLSCSPVMKDWAMVVWCGSRRSNASNLGGDGLLSPLLMMDVVNVAG